MNTNAPVDMLLQKIDDLGLLVKKQALILADQSALIAKLEAKIDGYTGVTSDLIRRVYEHTNKMVAGFTQKYNVDRLVY